MAILTFLNKDLRELIKDNASPAFMLVKDEGIYLLARPSDHVAYALGFRPDDRDSYERCREAVGGDDFTESFECTKKMIAFINQGATMEIDITSESFEISFIINKNHANKN